MRVINAKRGKPIILGYQGENGAVSVRFDVSGWEEAYGTGIFSLTNQRPTEPVGYPCSAISVEDGVLSWTVSNTDVSVAGDGFVQLTYTVDENIAKSEQYNTLVLGSINYGPVPTPAPDWVWEVRSAVAEAIAIASSIETATISQIDEALYS